LFGAAHATQTKQTNSLPSTALEPAIKAFKSFRPYASDDMDARTGR